MAANIEVILSEDVSNLGRAGEQVRVRPGYARNYLVPRGMAVAATKDNLRRIEHEKQLAVARAEKLRAEAKAVAATLDAVELECARPAGEDGRLYGSVTSREIAELLSARGHTVDRRKLHVPQSIRQAGDYEIEARLAEGVVARIKLRVTAQR